MTAYGLEQFIDDAEAAAGNSLEPADCVLAVAPLMHRLLLCELLFLEPWHFGYDPCQYALYDVHIAEGEGLSL